METEGMKEAWENLKLEIFLALRLSEAPDYLLTFCRTLISNGCPVDALIEASYAAAKKYAEEDDDE